MMTRVQERYVEWEKVVRNFIKKAEESRALGAVEVAKSLLLYGMKLYEDLNNNTLSEEQRLTFVNEMRQRTGKILHSLMK